MKIVYGLNNFKKKEFKKPVVAIGNFDGVHLGHKLIIKKAVLQAKKFDQSSIVLTFFPHPMRITDPNKTPALVTGIKHRIELISRFAPDVCLVAKFDKNLANMSADEFVRKILIKRLAAVGVIVGEKFNFGRKKSGNAKMLLSYGRNFSFDVCIVPALKRNNQVVSSSLIRRCIEHGKLNQAENLLGRKFSILGTVVKGDSRGKSLGFPTANIDPHQEALPPRGAYAVKIRIKNKFYNGMLYIGSRATFYTTKSNPVVEANIFDFNQSLYGKDIELIFVKKIRKDKKFKSAAFLHEQLEIDKRNALRILSQVKPVK